MQRRSISWMIWLLPVECSSRITSATIHAMKVFCQVCFIRRRLWFRAVRCSASMFFTSGWLFPPPLFPPDAPFSRQCFGFWFEFNLHQTVGDDECGFSWRACLSLETSLRHLTSRGRKTECRAFLAQKSIDLQIEVEVETDSRRKVTYTQCHSPERIEAN